MATTTDLPWQELHRNLRTFVARRVQNQADVDDLVQRVLLQIVRGLGSLRDAGRLHAWVYRTARNVIVDYYRAAAGRRELPRGDATDLDAAEGTVRRETFDEGDDRALQELAACLTPMLNALPPAYRDAVRAVDLEGATHAEAARRAGTSLSGMKSRVQRGRRQLREVFEACCRIDLDRQGSIADYTPRRPGACGCDGC